MRTIPLDIGPLHFVGIGGIGMSGLAEILHNLGYRVQGSDIAENANVARLRKLGIPIFIGHSEENLGEARVVVISSAVRKDNPEVAAGRVRLLPVVRRAEMLAELMHLKWAVAVGGTHGKTTTTSLIAAVLEGGGHDPTVVNGGIINAYGTNARLGDGDWMVIESDESDGSFTKLPATIAVVTNIDPEHMEHYGSFDALRDAFKSFVENVPFYGFACLCLDHPEVQALIPRVADRRIITYGTSPQAVVRVENMMSQKAGTQFDVVLRRASGKTFERMENIHLPMHGMHNIRNALAAIAVGWRLDVPLSDIRMALENFSGVERRFTRVGDPCGITVIDDYGHHPVEISAALSAARRVSDKNVVAVFQPHRYTRVRNLFEDFCTCFNDADSVIVSDIYAANEPHLEGITRQALVDGLRLHGHRRVLPLESPEGLADLVVQEAEPGDVVICLGAGSITRWAYDLAAALEKRSWKT